MQNKTFSIFYLPIFLFFSIFIHSADKYYPGSSWELVSAESQGIETKNVETLIDIAFTDNSTLGVVVIKNGKIIGEKYASGYDSDSHGTSWSMAKSYYAALIGISIDRGEIGGLDDKVLNYLEYFNDERSEITIRDLLDMSSGLDFPSHEHEKMFFQDDHLAYAKKVGVEKEAGIKFEYNNVNSMLLGDILYQATGKKADVLFEERILEPLEITDYKLWKDEKGNVMTYCCVDMSARDYSKFGLLFARNGIWNNEQIISKNFLMKHFKLSGIQQQRDLLDLTEDTPCIGGYRPMRMTLKFLILVASLVNIHLLIEKMTLLLQESQNIINKTQVISRSGGL